MTFDTSIMDLWAPTVKVAWDASDLIRWKMAPATSTPTTSLSEPTSAIPSDGTSSNLSRGARIGIAVGISVTVVAAMVATVLFWWRRRKGRGTSSKYDVATHKAELPGEGKRHAELADETGLHEAESEDKPNEAAHLSAPVELAGDWTGWEAPVVNECRGQELRHAPVDDVVPNANRGNGVEQT